MKNPEPHTNDISLATPAEQRAAIEAKVIEHLGENWKKDWLIVHDANELLRLHQGKINLDFQADLLGEVEIIEREANPLQLSGRSIAYLVLGASLFVALAIATVAGVFN